MTEVDPNVIREEIVNTIKTIKDPEIPVNIYDLGLIYGIEVEESGDVHIQMTLTSPNCPVADALPSSVKHKASEIEGVSNVKVELVWEPAWSPERMSEEAKLALDYMGPNAGFAPSSNPFTSISVSRPDRPTRR